MLEDFARPVAPVRQVRKAAELFETGYHLSAEECADAEKVEGFIRHLGPEIRKAFGRNDFKQDRLNRPARRDAGLDISRRRYNKLFRHLARLERKVSTYAREQRKYEFTRIGKSGLATRLPWEEFSRDPNSACFIAYFVSRSNLRSEFTISGQARPYDEIADMLFQRCRREAEAANWWAVAHVFTDPSVLARLTDAQKGQLLGAWLTVLGEIAELLREVWEKSDINRETMIVRRGNDSSTWNNTASAWNKARASWVALLHAMGMQAELDAMCFGKVLRLMAADVAAWHRAAGGDLDPNTKVWNEVPLPWEVLSGDAVCTREMVEQVCQKYGVDPVKNGWTAPPPDRKVAEFKPTPELVHGITVSSPQLAAALRKAGWFSGKRAVPLSEEQGPVRVYLDPHGFVVGAEDDEGA
ncbi:MAG TPA: hypothetical protein VD861_14425 [Pyrinomonadaceae bacterium]|nr:hypothetical protein [Pyrinomonadaceae bacterium]